MLLDSLFVDESLNKLRWDIDFSSIWLTLIRNILFSFKGANVQNLRVSLVLFWWLFYNSLNTHCWNSKDFDANIHDHKLFFLLVSETLIFLCCFSDAWLMIVWGNIDETAKILLQKLLIIIAFIALYSEILTIHCCFFDGSLHRIHETLTNSSKLLLRSIVLIFFLC